MCKGVEFYAAQEKILDLQCNHARSPWNSSLCAVSQYRAWSFDFQKSYYDFSDGTFTTEETYKKSNLIQNPDGSSVVYEDNYGFLISSVTHTNPENVSITESLYSKEQDSNRTAPNTFRKVSEIYDKKGTLLVRCEVSAVFDCTQLPATVSD